MHRARLEDMIKGWFVGDFSPAALRTPAAEVAVKRYAAGDAEERHHHKIATEVTVVVEGQVELAGVTYGPGDILVLEPGEATDFRARTAAVTVVVKVPSVAGDKYPGDAAC
jgi:quercetin dioxygenase-like cupin family protein